jgi:trehalose 6-phosphate phosphatase
VHGLVRRTAADEVIAAADAVPGAARAAVLALGAGHRGLRIEDKGASLAVHYRDQPALGPMALGEARKIAERWRLRLQEGRMVVELRAPGPDKGDAVAAFMREPPFAGRRPVYIGDDLTDEDGFAAATAMGGFGVIVGERRPTAAAYALADVSAALGWLRASLIA